MPAADPITDPIEVFLSYAHKDERLKNKLRTHLSLLQRRGVIADWHDRDITAGDEWKGQIDTHLKRARIILLLVSPDFLASDYCYDVELKRAMSRHRAGRAVVIPVFLRPCDWKGAPFGKIQGLPTDAEPVTGRRWSSQDEAFTIVARGIRVAVEKHRKEWQGATSATSPAPSTSSQGPAKQHASTSAKPAPTRTKQSTSSAEYPATKSQSVARPEGRKVSVRPQPLGNTGKWVLLGDRLFLSKGVTGRPDGSVEVQIVPGSDEEEADLRALAPDRAGYGRAVRFAHQNQAFWAQVRPLGSVSGAGRPAYTLQLTPETDAGSSWIEMGYNDLSADQVAEARARLLLLNEKPPTADRWQGGHLTTITVSQGGGQTLTESPFLTLWQQTRHQSPVFLRRARLWIVFYLKASGLCEHILELTLGPVQGAALTVRFRGRRRKAYDNQEAAVIRVAGVCPLVPEPSPRAEKSAG